MRIKLKINNQNTKIKLFFTVSKINQNTSKMLRVGEGRETSSVLFFSRTFGRLLTLETEALFFLLLRDFAIS